MKIQGPEKCLHCGKCLSVCPSYRVYLEENASPRGRNLALLHKVETSKLDLCLLCERCTKVCPQNISFPAGYIRSHLGKDKSKQSMLVSAEMEKIKNFPLHLLVKRRLDENISQYFSDTGEFYVYASCGLRVLYPKALIRFGERIGWKDIHIPKSAGCCGILHLALGDYESTRKRALRLLGVFNQEKPVVVFCATCFWMIKRVYPLLFTGENEENAFERLADRTFFAFDFLRKVFSLEAELMLDDKILYHFPCHLGLPLTSEENNLKNIVGAQDFCCGSARLLLWIKGFQENYRRYWRGVLRGKHYLLTLCTGCYLNFSFLLKEPPQIGHWMEFLR